MNNKINDKRLSEAITSLSKPKITNDQVEKVLKEFATSASSKKYLFKIVNWIVDIVKSNNNIKKTDSVQTEILVQLKLLNDNIQSLNENILELSKNERGISGETN